MRSFLLVAFGLLLAAASIFAAPVQGDFESRSLSSESSADAIFARGDHHPIPVIIGNDVPPEHHHEAFDMVQDAHNKLNRLPQGQSYHARSAVVTPWQNPENFVISGQQPFITVKWHRTDEPIDETTQTGTTHLYKEKPTPQHHNTLKHPESPVPQRRNTLDHPEAAKPKLPDPQRRNTLDHTEPWPSHRHHTLEAEPKSETKPEPEQLKHVSQRRNTLDHPEAAKQKPKPPPQRRHSFKL